MKARVITVMVFLVLVSGQSMGHASSPGAEPDAPVIWIALGGRIDFKKMSPGAQIEGRLWRSVYWRDTEIFPKDSTVRLVIDKIQRRKKWFAADDRPFLIHIFAPRHEVAASFRSVNVVMPGGAEVPLRAKFIALSQRAVLKAEVKKTKAAEKPEGGELAQDPCSRKRKPLPPWILSLQVEPEDASFAALADAKEKKASVVPAPCVDPCAIADGTHMPLMLLQGLSASKNHRGQIVRAELLAPVLIGSTLAIPQGAILQGELAKRVPPRRLYRPGSLNLIFTSLTLPSGATTQISASPVGAEVDKGTHMTMDGEGIIHAQHPGKARFLLDFGVSGGISKVSDDTTQLIIEAISSTATDASTAGVARFAAMGGTAIYMLTRHGRDVILPPFTEMDVSLSHAVSLEGQSPAGNSFH